MAEDIIAVSQKLAAAIQVNSNDPHINVLLQEAYKLCEEVKETSPLCAQCGFYLATLTNSPIVRHLGLHLIAHCVKFRWSILNQDEKIYIKNNVMQLLATGTDFIVNEQAHIKDALARIAVEMIAREWPQQWPTLLQELNDLCLMGETQKELVLLIFLRLAEDIVVFQNIPKQRRRDIYHGLTSNMNDIFNFFLSTVKDHYKKYSDLKHSSNNSEKQKALVHCRVAETTLSTLAGFVEWVPIAHITADNSQLLQILCLLLGDEGLQERAAECLCLIVSRKGKLEERKPLLVLFSEDAMSVIFSAASSAASASLNEQRYNFLKKLCEVLTGLGSQLSALWGVVDDVEPPSTFSVYLNCILEFTKHPSQKLCSFVLTLWIMFFRHETISQNSVLQSFIPKVVECCMAKLIKVGLPSHTDSPSCDYSRLDFDSDEDFVIFFIKFRAETGDTVRAATSLAPVITFHFAAQWLQNQLSEPIDVGANSENGLCTLNSPSFLRWDALSVFMENVMSRLFNNDKPKPSSEEGIQLLKSVLAYETKDPIILSCVLSCISALFSFLNLAPDMLLSVLHKIFSSVIFILPGQTKATRSRTVKNVRRHACSSLVKICKQNPKLLLPSFDQIYNHIKSLINDPEQLSQMEKCTLIESLILISNEFNEYNQQQTFIHEILVPVSNIWMSAEFYQAFSNVEAFMALIGLDRAPVEPSAEDAGGINRSQIIHCVDTFLGVIKRSKCPTNLEVANKGGFLGSSQESGSSYIRNPATPNIIPHLERLFSLIRSLNEIWVPTVKAKIHPYFIPSLDILEADKNNILGLNIPCVEVLDSNTLKQPCERMKNFLATIHDSCYHVLGNAAASLGLEFYAMPDLSAALLNSALSNVEHMPDYRLRSFIRVFVKPFFQHCPSEYYSSGIPILEVLCPFMYTRLSTRWENFRQRQGTNEDAEETETQEVLEDQLNRQLTREYIDFLGVLLHHKKSEPCSDAMEEEINHSANLQSDTLTDLGNIVITAENVWPSIISTIFNALYWLDTTASLKSIQICWPVLKKLVAENLINENDIAVYLFNCVLMGLQELGEHEANQALLIGLGLQTYEALRPRFPAIVSVLHTIPGSKGDDIVKLNEKIKETTQGRQVPDKRKKENFKKIVSGVIGKNIGQCFKREVHIRNLPPIFRTTRPKSLSLDEIENSNLGLCSLFKEAKSHLKT